jgi:hypothetical protein
MGYTINSLILGLTALLLYILQKQTRRSHRSQQRGCQPPAKLYSYEPFFGLDVTLLTSMDIPSLSRHHEKLGKTFEVSALLGLSEICTVETENIRVLNTAGKIWGIEPFRLPG